MIRILFIINILNLAECGSQVNCSEKLEQIYTGLEIGNNISLLSERLYLNDHEIVQNFNVPLDSALVHLVGRHSEKILNIPDSIQMVVNPSTREKKKSTILFYKNSIGWQFCILENEHGYGDVEIFAQDLVSFLTEYKKTNFDAIYFPLKYYTKDQLTILR